MPPSEGRLTLPVLKSRLRAQWFRVQYILGANQSISCETRHQSIATNSDPLVGRSAHRQNKRKYRVRQQEGRIKHATIAFTAIKWRTPCGGTCSLTSRVLWLLTQTIPAYSASTWHKLETRRQCDHGIYACCRLTKFCNRRRCRTGIMLGKTSSRRG